VSADGFEPVAKLDDLADGGLLAVRTADGREVCLYRSGDVIGAVDNVCTHAEFAMSDGQLYGGQGCVIECVWHGARYDCRTGAVMRGPATDPLPVYAVRVENGMIHVGPRVRNDSL
jgi:3-phenylpropionate/trans-cinnamate dioxygenase ferredoxin subunit